MRLRDRIAGALAAAALFAAAAGVQAQPPPRRIAIDVTISHATDAEGTIDPRAGQLDALLKPQFRYGGLKVLQEQRLNLALDEVGTLKLPTGRKLRVRPLDVGPEGVLLSVAVQGTLWTDMRVRNGHPVVIGAERYQDGKLVIGLEPHF